VKKAAWQQHIDAFNKNNLSKMAHANKHDLVYSQLLYWRQKLSPKKEEPFSFVKIKPARAVSTLRVLGTLEFPSGAKLCDQHGDSYYCQNA
jgi:hypothetical protein